VTILRGLTVRLRALVRRDLTDHEVDEELRFHIDREVERRVAAGVPGATARADVRRAFGNATAHAEAARDALRWQWLEQLGADVRYAARSLRATPTFTIVAALSFAFAFGANVVTFSTIDALLWRRLPVRAPEQLVGTHGGSYSMYQAMRTVNTAFSDVAAVAIVDRTNFSTSQAASNSLTRVALVTGNYFSLLGVNAAVGRIFAESDDQSPGGHPIAVVSDRFWRARLGVSRSAVGGKFRLNATTYTIVGIAPLGFDGEAVGRPVDVWIPMMMQSEVMPEWPGLLKVGNGFLRILMRMRPGITVAAAQAAIQPAYRAHEIAAAGANASAEFRASLERDPFQLVSIERGYSASRDEVAKSLGIVGGLVALVLLVACTNVATLMLVRGASKEREMAIRAAIGAGRARLARQVLTESIVLSALGGVTGVTLALWSTIALSTTVSIGPVKLDARAPSSMQSLDLVPSVRVLAVAAIASVVISVLFGAGPAMRAARARGSQALLSRRAAIGGSGRRRGRFGGGLVVVQIALSLALLAATGLLVKSLHNLERRELGVDRAHLLLAWAVPAQTQGARDDYARYVDRLIARVSEVRGVVSVSVTNHGLLEGGDEGGESNLLTIDGHTAAAGLQVMRDGVGPNFFSTAGISLVAGRDLLPTDDSSHTRVVVINERMARTLFGTESPVGKHLGAPRNPVEIVGVVRDVRHGSPRDMRGIWYVPYRQAPGLFRNVCIVVRTASAPSAHRLDVQRALQAFDPTLPVLRVDTLDEQLADVLFLERTVASVAIALAVMAALLACIGLYGVVAYAVSRRENEIGVRVALGATQRTVVGMIVGDSVRIAMLGVILGIPGAVILTRILSSRLYGIGRNDVSTLLAASSVMLLIAVVAGCLPARRASAIDPATTLRAE
jgi:predicted permease